MQDILRGMGYRRKPEPKPLPQDKVLLAARLYREGKDLQEIERLTGIPPDRQGQAVAQGLRLLYGQSP